ncbi:hypothetical protein L596_001332 [Steinernema carpocapsae]|uniref:Uncharacterized protein n=1 Tax=Steinernema carpocapsae TaxID=34508 RepID=A0A4U8UKQ6_STECR|nr:hypothetical protein L596_001332 [Steinernema carpocapsae]
MNYNRLFGGAKSRLEAYFETDTLRNSAHNPVDYQKYARYAQVILDCVRSEKLQKKLENKKFKKNAHINFERIDAHVQRQKR